MLATFIRKPMLVRPLFRRCFSASNSDYSKDLYKILGVSANADKAQIKSAYTTLVKTYHPDVNKSANPEAFKEINMAYSVLSNDEKKRDYDSYLQSKSKMSDPRNFNGGSASTSYEQARTYTNVCGYHTANCIRRLLLQNHLQILQRLPVRIRPRVSTTHEEKIPRAVLHRPLP